VEDTDDASATTTSHPPQEIQEMGIEDAQAWWGNVLDGADQQQAVHSNQTLANREEEEDNDDDDLLETDEEIHDADVAHDANCLQQPSLAQDTAEGESVSPPPYHHHQQTNSGFVAVPQEHVDGVHDAESNLNTTTTTVEEQIQDQPRMLDNNDNYGGDGDDNHGAPTAYENNYNNAPTVFREYYQPDYSKNVDPFVGTAILRAGLYIRHRLFPQLQNFVSKMVIRGCALRNKLTTKRDPVIETIASSLLLLDILYTCYLVFQDALLPDIVKEANDEADDDDDDDDDDDGTIDQ